MTLIGQNVLTAAGKKNAPLRKWLAEWITVVEQTDWQNLIDVRRDYPSADGVQGKENIATVFNAKGNQYRLITLIDYAARIVVVGEIITHAEYNKNRWKERY